MRSAALRYAVPVVAAMLLNCSSLWSQEPKTDAPQFKTAKEKVSYGFGLNVGRGMIRDGLRPEDIDFNILVQGLRDALANKDTALTEDDFKEAFETYIAPRLAERSKQAAEKIKAEGEAFLAENKSKPGVKTTASGLQYKVLKAGDGKSPGKNDTVHVTYKGTFTDGTLFDQSQDPISFSVDGVIKGWTEALQLMREGDKFQLVVPPDLAYGEKGHAPVIPPHAVLVFEVELHKVEKAPADRAAPAPPKAKSRQ